MDKKFKLINIYNTDVNDFFCKIEKNYNFMLEDFSFYTLLTPTRSGANATTPE